ncbi:MAG: hypothetical protein CBD88_00740 [Flavobacteriales bacterium TMED228]|nr:MAG: hypothetical protein CBD88_00740 [Flavobacteriales bacterium TMED228]
MAGIAPMYEGMGPMRLEDGGFLDDLRRTAMKIPGAETAVDVYDDIDFRGIPGRALEEIKNIDVSGIIDDNIDTEDFFTTDRTEEGSGMNLRDLTDLVFDPTDPFDLMTVPLVMYPPAFAAARLAKVGITGNKLSKQLGKIDTAKKLLGEGKDKTKSGIGNYFKLQVGQDLAEGAKSGYDYFTEPEGKAAGGIMSFKKGDYVSRGFFEDLFSTGESLAKAGKRILGIGDDVVEETVKKKVPKKGGGKKETKKEREEREKREREEAEKKEKKEGGDEEVGSGTVTKTGLYDKTKNFVKNPLVLGPTAFVAGSQLGGDSEGQVAELEAQVADLNKQLENAAKNDGTNSQAYTDALSKITAYEAKIKELEAGEKPSENLLTKALNKLRGAAGSAGSIDPSVLAGLINMGSSTDLFEPPKTTGQKFLEGRQGFRMQEAEIDKAKAAVRQADASDMLDVEKQFNLFKTRIESATGKEMSQQDQAALFLNIQRDARDQKNLMSLFATAAPGMINEQAINEFRNQNTEKFVRDQLNIP